MYKLYILQIYNISEMCHHIFSFFNRIGKIALLHV